MNQFRADAKIVYLFLQKLQSHGLISSVLTTAKITTIAATKCHGSKIQRAHNYVDGFVSLEHRFSFHYILSIN